MVTFISSCLQSYKECSKEVGRKHEKDYIKEKNGIKNETLNTLREKRRALEKERNSAIDHLNKINEGQSNSALTDVEKGLIKVCEDKKAEAEEQIKKINGEILALEAESYGQGAMEYAKWARDYFHHQLVNKVTNCFVDTTTEE